MWGDTRTAIITQKWNVPSNIFGIFIEGDCIIIRKSGRNAMPTREKRLIEIELRSSALSEAEIAVRHQQLEDFMAINAFEGLYPSALSLRLQACFAEEKLSPDEYIALCRQYLSFL
jgi:hypothetical protein